MDKVYHFSYKYAWESEMWANGLRNAIEVEKEIKRTIHGVIKYNIGILYFYFNSHLDNEIIKIVLSITRPLSMELSAAEFSDEIKNVSHELNYFFDAFYAHKPFIFMLFKFVATHLQTDVKTKVSSYWNKYSQCMNAGEVIGFINAFDVYDRTTKAWGIEDPRLQGWVNPLLKTFICKLYANCRKILANILYDLRNNFKIENHRLSSNASQNLESHLNFIFDHYSQIPTLEAAELLVGTCSTILLLFLINVKNFVRTENFPLQIYIALLNNNFLKVIKNLQKKVHNTTNSQISFKEIKTKLDEEFLITTITDIEKLAFNKVAQYLNARIQATFNDGQDLIAFDVLKTLTNLTAEFEALIKLVDNRFYIADLYTEMFEDMTKLYYSKFLEFAPKVTTKNYTLVVNKLGTDTNALEKSMSLAKVENTSAIKFKLKQLIRFFSSEDIDEVIMCVMNMHIFFEELIEPRNIARMLKAKIFFPSNSIEYILNYLKSSLEVHAKSKSIRKNLLSLFSMNPHVFLFIRNLSKLRRKGREGEEAKRRTRSKHRAEYYEYRPADSRPHAN